MSDLSNILIVCVFGMDDWGGTYLDSHLINKEC